MDRTCNTNTLAFSSRMDGQELFPTFPGLPENADDGGAWPCAHKLDRWWVEADVEEKYEL